MKGADEKHYRTKILSFIEKSDPSKCTTYGIASRLHIHFSTVDKALKVFRSKRLIQETKVPRQFRRKVPHALTESGRKVLELANSVGQNDLPVEDLQQKFDKNIIETAMSTGVLRKHTKRTTFVGLGLLIWRVARDDSYHPDCYELPEGT